METAISDDEIKKIAQKELVIWEIITNEIRSISKKLKDSGVLNEQEYYNLQDAYNHCEDIRIKLQLIIKPSPYIQKSIHTLVQEMRYSLENEYKQKLEWLIRDLKSSNTYNLYKFPTRMGRRQRIPNPRSNRCNNRPSC